MFISRIFQISYPTASPIFLQIVEDWLAFVVVAGGIGVVIGFELLVAAFVGAFVEAVFCDEHFLLFGFLGLLLFLLYLEF
jgi:hypothetical protein